MNTISRTAQRSSRQQAGAMPATALPRLRQQRLALSLAVALGSVSFCGGALAAVAGGVAPGTTPIGGVVVGGSGSIAQNGVNTVINQNSALLALNWQSFNVGKDATVLFNQPSFNAVALNRILDQSPSQIFGHINSNGQVFLINTHGIIFGSSAQLNVGGLVASTLDLTPNDFLSNHFNLDAHGGSAGVVNHGTIQAASGGSVSLVGGKVENDGLIVANYGRINLDGADKAVLDFDGNGLINVQITGALQQRLSNDEAAVTNNGRLQADGGTVVLQASAAKDLFTNLVNNTGVIDAHGISTDGGVVRLVGSGGNTVSGGSIDASGVHGGSVQLLSDQNVGVMGGSIDASGTQGGGSIRVGDFLDRNTPSSFRQAGHGFACGTGPCAADLSCLGCGRAAARTPARVRPVGRVRRRAGRDVRRAGALQVHEQEAGRAARHRRLLPRRPVPRPRPRPPHRHDEPGEGGHHLLRAAVRVDRPRGLELARLQPRPARAAAGLPSHPHPLAAQPVRPEHRLPLRLPDRLAPPRLRRCTCSAPSSPAWWSRP